MNNYMRTLIRCLVLAVACLVSVAWATDTLTVQNPGAGAVMGGVYTSPYGISVNGTPTLLICDDFETSIYAGESWTANPATLTQISSAAVSALKFANSTYSPAILQSTTVAEDYATAAVLAAELMALPNFGTLAENTETAGELSFAIWSVFDNSLYTNLNSSSHTTGYGSLTSTEVNAVDADIANAQALVSAATAGGITNLNNISINGQPIGGLMVYSPSPLGVSQEFISVNPVHAAEPPSPVLLGFDLLGLAGLMFFVRRRWSIR
jgi:hypothetical protein